jgi:hypothetical protein
MNPVAGEVSTRHLADQRSNRRIELGEHTASGIQARRRFFEQAGDQRRALRFSVKRARRLSDHFGSEPRALSHVWQVGANQVE